MFTLQELIWLIDIGLVLKHFCWFYTTRKVFHCDGKFPKLWRKIDFCDRICNRNQPVEIYWSQIRLWGACHNCDGTTPVTNIFDGQLWRMLWRNIPACDGHYDGNCNGKFRHNFEAVSTRGWNLGEYVTGILLRCPSQIVTDVGHNFNLHGYCDRNFDRHSVTTRNCDGKLWRNSVTI